MKGHGHVNSDFLLFRRSSVQNLTFVQKFHQDRNVGQHRVLQLVGFNSYLFSKFPEPPRVCLQQLVKVGLQSDEVCVHL